MVYQANGGYAPLHPSVPPAHSPADPLSDVGVLGEGVDRLFVFVRHHKGRLRGGERVETRRMRVEADSIERGDAILVAIGCGFFVRTLHCHAHVVSAPHCPMSKFLHLNLTWVARPGQNRWPQTETDAELHANASSTAKTQRKEDTKTDRWTSIQTERERSPTESDQRATEQGGGVRVRGWRRIGNRPTRWRSWRCSWPR